jgi:hypothetical protein
MPARTQWGFLGAALLTTGLVFAGQGPAQARPNDRIVLASNYDPYTLGSSPCPQGAPYGGPKCEKLLPRSRSHPLG